MAKIIDIIEVPPKPKFDPFLTKKSTQSEVTVIFTKNCNLKCDFCKVIHDHPEASFEDFNADVINRSLPLTLAAIERQSKNHIDMSFFGGEIFQDKFDQSVFDAFDHFLNACRTKIVSLGKTYDFTLMTNIITKNIDRTIAFAKKYDTDVHASFDFAGRFTNPKLVDLWFDNMAKMRAAGLRRFSATFNTIKPNVDAIMSHDPVWKKIYENYDIILNYYDDIGVEEYVADEKLLGQLLIFLYQNYPKVGNIRDIVERFRGIKPGTTCVQSTTVTDRINWECCDRYNVIQEFRKNKGCLKCEFFEHCPVDCPRTFHKSKDCLNRIFLTWYKENGMDLQI